MVALSNDSTWVVESTGIDLYSGLAGIGLGFAYAGKLLQQTCYSEVARDCLNTMLWKMAYQPADDQQVVGGFSGLDGTREASAFGQAFVKGIFQHATVMHSTFGFLMQI